MHRRGTSRLPSLSFCPNWFGSVISSTSVETRLRRRDPWMQPVECSMYRSMFDKLHLDYMLAVKDEFRTMSWNCQLGVIIYFHVVKAIGGRSETSGVISCCWNYWLAKVWSFRFPDSKSCGYQLTAPTGCHSIDRSYTVLDYWYWDNPISQYCKKCNIEVFKCTFSMQYDEKINTLLKITRFCGTFFKNIQRQQLTSQCILVGNKTLLYIPRSASHLYWI